MIWRVKETRSDKPEPERLTVLGIDIGQREVRTMFTKRTCTTFILALGVSAAMLFPVASQAQSDCNWYAQTALKQQQKNQKGKCGFSGQGWSTDFKSHLSWCGSVAPEEWKAAAQAREQDLQGCGASR